ncbi:hypothetical protein CNO08_14515 [Lysobacter capsici]|nr:hypothetical protein CNO08_14515 [Lysobacter capsici]
MLPETQNSLHSGSHLRNTRWVFCACYLGASSALVCVGRAANTTPARGIRPPSVYGFEPPDFPPAT